MERYIYHITSTSAYQSAKDNGQYTHPTLQSEGFIHCSQINQVAATANRHFKGQTDLLVLEIDMSLVEPEIILESTNDRDEYYPHIYGPLNTDSIRQVFKLETDEAGKFAFGSK